MSSILEQIAYKIHDALGKKSYAESQRDKYKNVMDTVKRKRNNFDLFEQDWEEMKADYDVMEKNPYSAEGKMRTTFEAKEQISRAGMRQLFIILQTGIDNVENNLRIAEGQYEYWKQVAIDEDNNYKEYQAQYFAQQQKEAEEAARAAREAAERAAREAAEREAQEAASVNKPRNSGGRTR